MADATPVDPHPRPPVPRVPNWTRRWVGFPALLPPLVGRERDIAALLGLLRQEEPRLITLTGPGGVGKTRLAIAAADAAELADGAVFVPLAAVTDPALVVPAIAQALDVRETPERPLRDALVDALRERGLLLVLDNFEHVLPAAADLVHLLAACPRLTALVTSREPLRLTVEQRYVTPPLALPAPGDSPPLDALTGYAAIALFIARARAVRHDFALDAGNAAAVVEICRRLDGLPLAIELAAAWMRALPPAALLARLEPRLALLHGGADDQPIRLRTMRDAIAWSYDLLSADEARLFRRLAIFVGGFTLETAEWVAGWRGGRVAGESEVGGRESGGVPPATQPPSHPATLDLLVALIDKSLVQAVHGDGQEPRYQMLETVREFGLEQLTASGEAGAIAAAHAAAMRDFAERVEPVLLGPEEQEWQARVGVELGNLRAALAWGLEHDVETTLRIAAALWAYWSWYQVAEGRRWLTAALERAAPAPALVQARALTTAGALAALEGDFLTSSARSSAAVPFAVASGDRVAEARARWIVACAWFYTARIEAAVPELDQALALFEQATSTTDRVWGAYARSQRAGAAALLGDAARGIALYEEAAARARAAGSEGITLAILSDLAGWLIDRGETTRARGLLREALALAGNRRERWLVEAPLLNLALVAAIEGETASAARLLGAAEAVLMRAGLGMPTYMQQRIDRAAALARDALGDETFTTMWEAGRADPAAVIAAALGDADAPGAAPGDDVATAYGLTRRERDVLRLLADGRTDKEIAAALFVARRTASKHVAAILTKLDVDSRTAAVSIALRRGVP